MSTHHDFLLYGTNGYTGRLIAQEALRLGMKPLLAGRNAPALADMARGTGLECIAFRLEETEKLHQALLRCRFALHAAGPFRSTLNAMVAACIRTGRHYTDINGDVYCFERIRAYDGQAREAGVMVLPGAGFDVIPTDCLARHLHERMPDAVRLRIAFASVGSGMSHGTAMTMISKLGEGGMVRRNGKILRRPFGEKGMQVDFGEENLFVMSIPWGDVATAHHTTGIPDIETYTAVRPAVYKLMKLQRLFNPLLRSESVRSLLRRKAAARPPGPDSETRARAYSLVWAELTDASGRSVHATMKGPEPYDVTAHGILAVARRILSGDVKPGYQTPAGCYGADLAMEIPGMRRSEPVFTR